MVLPSTLDTPNTKSTLDLDRPSPRSSDLGLLEYPPEHNLSGWGLREFRSLAQGHGARKWRGRDLNTGKGATLFVGPRAKCKWGLPCLKLIQNFPPGGDSRASNQMWGPSQPGGPGDRTHKSTPTKRELHARRQTLTPNTLPPVLCRHLPPRVIEKVGEMKDVGMLRSAGETHRVLSHLLTSPALPSSWNTVPHPLHLVTSWAPFRYPRRLPSLPASLTWWCSLDALLGTTAVLQESSGKSQLGML